MLESLGERSDSIEITLATGGLGQRSRSLERVVVVLAAVAASWEGVETSEKSLMVRLEVQDRVRHPLANPCQRHPSVPEQGEGAGSAYSSR